MSSSRQPRLLAPCLTLLGVIVGFAHAPVAAAQATCSSTQPIACGEVKTGNLVAVGETDCFQFTAEAGEVVTLLAKATTAGMQGCAQLRDAGGQIVGGDTCGQPTTLTLPSTGTYTLRLFDQSNDQTGSYAVQLQVLSATASSCPETTLLCGASHAGTLASTIQSDTYRVVAAEAGEVVSITTADTTSPFEACWQLYAADGSTIGALACAEGSRTLPTADPYTIRVFDLANDQTGTYRVEVTVVSATAGSCRDATLLCGVAHPGGITTIGDNDVYWFTTTAPNEPVDVETVTTSGSVNACWQLYDAAGTAIDNISCGSAERVIATPGTYVLRVFDLTYENAGTYDVSASKLPACPATPTPTPTVTVTVTPTVTVTVTATNDPGTPTPGATSSGGDPNATPTGAGTVTPSNGAGATATASPGSGGTPTPQSTPSIQNLEAVLDDFLCYTTKLAAGAPPFTPTLGMRLSDTLESLDFNVRKPTQLCAPADKDGNGIANPATSLQRYRLQRVRGAARFVRSTRRVVTALGPLSLDTIRPDQLLVPTAESAVTSPTPPDPETHHVDRYKCYRVRVTRRTPKVPFDLQVTLTDTLSSPGRRFKVKSPTRLCVTTIDDPLALHNPAGHLLCYPVKLIRGERKHVKQRGLYLGNDLGATRVDTARESELCVPALFAP